MKKRLGIDMDGVIANLLDEWIRRYNEDYDDNFTKDQITHWYWYDLVKSSCSKKIYDYLKDPNLFLNAPVIKDSQDVLKKLSKKYEIFVITSHTYASNIEPKERWLRIHFPFIPESNYVFTKNKKICRVDIMIDDKAENLEMMDDCVKLLFDAPHNLKEERFLRMKDWKHVAEYFGV